MYVYIGMIGDQLKSCDPFLPTVGRPTSDKVDGGEGDKVTSEGGGLNAERWADRIEVVEVEGVGNNGQVSSCMLVIGA